MKNGLSKPIALLFHGFFFFVYSLLFARGVIAFREDPVDLSNLLKDSTLTMMIRRMSGIIIEPFFGVITPPAPEGYDYLIATIAFTAVCYALFHYGIFAKPQVKEDDFLINKIVNVCRMIFFILGTLLILLVVIRMSVELYYDIAYGGGRGSMVIIDPNKR